MSTIHNCGHYCYYNRELPPTASEWKKNERRYGQGAISQVKSRPQYLACGTLAHTASTTRGYNYIYVGFDWLASKHGRCYIIYTLTCTSLHSTRGIGYIIVIVFTKVNKRSSTCTVRRNYLANAPWKFNSVFSLVICSYGVLYFVPVSNK